MTIRAPMNDLQIIDKHSERASVWDTAFDEADFITSLAALASRQTVVSFTPPQGMLGILDGMATAVQNLSDWDNLVWALLVNKVPVPGYDYVMGPVGSIQIPQSMYCPIMAGQTISVVITSLSASTINYPTALIIGRFFSNVIPETLP